MTESSENLRKTRFRKPPWKTGSGRFVISEGTTCGAKSNCKGPIFNVDEKTRYCCEQYYKSGTHDKP